MATFSQDDLFRLDQEFAEKNVPLHARPFQAALQILANGQPAWSIQISDGFEEICDAYVKLFPESEAWPGAGQGLAVSIDRARVITLPAIYGSNKLSIHDMLGFPDEAEWLAWCRNDTSIAARSAYAAADLHDLCNALDTLAPGTQQETLARRSLQHLGDVAAILSVTGGASDTALQHVALIPELALKAALVHFGFTLAELKDKFGHNLPKLARALASSRPHPDDERMLRICEKIPNLVASRYTESGMSRKQICELAVASQFVAAAALRRISPDGLASQIEKFSSRPEFLL